MSTTPAPPAAESAPAKRRMSTKQRLLFFATGWLIVLMPFLFWWNTWFGRQLPDAKLAEYLHDDAHPRHIQHALVQIGERMARHDASVEQWYPTLVSLAANPVEEIRNTDAWVMGQDTSGPGFHAALLAMLNDASPMVRGNAALSLVRFGDATGRPQIAALLAPAKITAPQSGTVADATTAGTAIHQGGLIAKLDAGGQAVEVRSPIGGRVQNIWAQKGQPISAGADLATVAPSTEQVWEALRALYLVGERDDLAVIRPYERDVAEVPEHVRQQALATEKAIVDRNR